MLQECYSWALRNGAAQLFFQPNKNTFSGKFVKWERFLAVFSMWSELRFVKWMRFFERNCIIKWVIFFASFCWLWDFLLKDLKLKKTLMMSTGRIQKSYILEIIFSKTNSNYEILNHLYFGLNFVFLGTT